MVGLPLEAAESCAEFSSAAVSFFTLPGRCTELPVLCAGKLRVVHAMGYARLHLLCEENEVMDATQQLVDSENAGAAPVPFRVAATTASWIPRSSEERRVGKGCGSQGRCRWSP